MAFGKIGSVRSDFVRNDAFLHILLVRQAEMLFRRDIAEHRGTEPPDHRGADR